MNHQWRNKQIITGERYVITIWWIPLLITNPWMRWWQALWWEEWPTRHPYSTLQMQEHLVETWEDANIIFSSGRTYSSWNLSECEEFTPRNYQSPNLPSEGEWARRFFDHWKESLKWHRLEPYEKFAEMIERHWDGMAAYSRPENKVSLGFVEGLNHKIRVIQRRAYGLRDAEYLRPKILTCMLKEIWIYPLDYTKTLLLNNACFTWQQIESVLTYSFP